MVKKSNDNYNPSRRGFLEKLTALTGIAFLGDIPVPAAANPIAPEINAATNEAINETAKFFLNELRGSISDLRLNDIQLKMLQSPFVPTSTIQKSRNYFLDRQTERVDGGIAHFKKIRTKFKQAFPEGFQNDELNSFMQELHMELDISGQKFLNNEYSELQVQRSVENLKNIETERLQETNKLISMSDEEFEAFATQRHQEALNLDQQYKEFFEKALDTPKKDKVEAEEQTNNTVEKEDFSTIHFEVTRNVRKDKETGDTIYRIALPRTHDDSTHKTMESKASWGERTSAFAEELKSAYPDIKIESTDRTRGQLFVHASTNSKIHSAMEKQMEQNKSQELNII